MKYQYPTANHWMYEKTQKARNIIARNPEGMAPELRIVLAFAEEMAKAVDGDDIKSLFEEEMENDGYFEEGP